MEGRLYKDDPAESPQQRAPPPDKLTWILKQKNNQLKYTVEGEQQGKKNVFTADVSIGGEPYESDAARIISAEWKDDSVAVNTLYNPDNERRASMEEIWTLSKDGNKLTDNVIYHVPSTAKNHDDIRFKRVFDRE